jgi:hypothetical protein
MIKIYKLALQYILVNIRLCPNLMCIWVQKMLWGIEFSKIDFELYETLWKIYPIVNNVWSYVIKTIYFFIQRLWTKICFHTNLYKILTKFEYYYNYYVVIWKKVWIVSRRHLNFSSISRTWTRIEHMSLIIIFVQFLLSY